jgi:hypothetical protein
MVLAAVVVAGCDDGASAPPFETLAARVAPLFLSVDDTSVYWSETTVSAYGGPLKRFNKDSTPVLGVETIGVGYQPLVVGHVVYTTTSSISTLSLTRYTAPGQASALGDFSGFGSRLATDGENVYFSTYDFSTSTTTIWAQPVNGSPARMLVQDGHGQPNELVAGDGELYWIADPTRGSVASTAGEFGTIMKVAVSGGSAIPVLESPTVVDTLALDADQLYFVVDNPGGSPSTAKPDQTLAKLDRRTGDIAAVTDTRAANSLRLDGGYLYWADAVTGVRRVPAAGGQAETLVEMSGVNFVATDADHVYWSTWRGPTASPEGAVMRKLKPAAAP